MAGKEAESSETFSEDDYRDKLVNDGYSETTAKMLAKKKKEALAARVGKIEINLGSLSKAKKRVWVKATATKKGHYREQEAGKKDGISAKDRAMANLMIKSGKKHEVKMGRYILDGNKGMAETMRQGFPNTWKKYEDMAKSEDEEIEHLSPEERKKRQKDRDKRQKERAVHRAVRQKQHEEVEEGIPEGK